MRTIRRYLISITVALVACLPLAYRFFPNLPLGVQVLIAVLIGGGAFTVDHFRNVRPRLLLEDERTYLFSTVCRTVLEDLREHDPTARLNIMEIDYRLIRSLSVFKVIYTLGMGDDPDKNPQLKLTQGVPGQAVARKGFCVADLESKHTPMFGLTADQYDKTKELTLVLSMPIKRTEKMPDGSFVLADDVIGVVNIDTKRPSAHRYYESIILYFNNGGSEGISLLDWQWRRMQEISELSSYILS